MAQSVGVGLELSKNRRQDGLVGLDEYLIEITEFRSQTFSNFETFSMALADVNYNEEVFRLGQIFWGKDLIAAAGGLSSAQRLQLQFTHEQFSRRQMMVIFCDRYGNEKALLFRKEDFQASASKTSAARKPQKKGSRQRSARKATGMQK